MFGGKNRVRLARLELLARAWSDTEALQPSVTIRLMDSGAAAKWGETWSSDRTPPEGGWDWPAISDGCRGKTDDFCIAIWHGGTTLCGVFLLAVRGIAVQLRAVEGNPDENHPLKGSVIAIGIDVAERFAGLLRRQEIWLVEPADGLIDLYVETFGYELAESDDGRRICKRRV